MHFLQNKAFGRGPSLFKPNILLPTVKQSQQHLHEDELVMSRSQQSVRSEERRATHCKDAMFSKILFTNNNRINTFILVCYVMAEMLRSLALN